MAFEHHLRFSERTRIVVYHCSYIWNVVCNHNSQSPVLRMSLPDFTELKDASFQLSFLRDEILEVKIIPTVPYVWFWGRIHVYNRADIEPDNICCIFSSTQVVAKFKLSCVHMLKNCTDFFYNNGNLTLLLEFNISENFDVHKDTSFMKLSLAPAVQMDIETPSLLQALSTDMKNVYEEQKVSDVNIKVKDRVFRAHKNILCARSPVFSSMLQSSMSESQNNIINISDLDENTVEAMLLCLYSGTVEQLQWESALKLYYAGDKYQIVSLRNKCKSFIKSRLSTSNVCEAMLLAHMHQDDDLMITVKDFIYHHRPEAFCSEAWKSFIASQPQLAAEAMQYCFETEKIQKS